MKKALFIFFALISITTQGQVANGTETKQNAFRSLNPQTATTVNYLTTMGADGTMGRVTPVNVTIPTVPLNYSVTAPTLGAHLQGIDNRFGTLVATTAGNTTRVWFTGDATTIGAGTFYLTNAVNKGTVANVSQSVINDDDQKKYFTQDLIGNAFATTTIFPPGVYAGNLSGSTTPNSARQKFTVELYRCDTNGNPIASGVAGAPVGDLGVTVIIILDSGELTLADGSVTNVSVSANLATSLTINVGERIRYHVSAAKVGTNASNITESVWYGNSFNSYIDVPTPITSSGVSNLSTVTGATVTTALDNLNTGKENISNKATDFSTVNNTLYPTVQATKTQLDTKTTILNTISDMLSYTGVSKEINVLEADRGGVFYFVASGLTSDNGIVFPHASSGFWVRRLSGFVIPEFWGTGTTTSFSFIQSALNYAAGKNIAVNLLPKQYNIDDCLIIKSNTELRLDKATVIRLNDNTNKSMIRNFGAIYAGSASIVDSNITVSGGTWEGNGANQTLYSSGGSPSVNVGLEFHNIENLRLKDFKVNIARSYAIYLSSTKDVFIERLNIDNGDVINLNRDGIHLNGPSVNTFINDCILRGTDDQIALNANDVPYPYKVDAGGDMVNTVINNIVFNNTLKGIRLLSAANNINNIIINNVTGSTTGNIMDMGNYGLGSGGSLSGLQVSNLNIKINQPSDNGYSTIKFDAGSYGDIAFSNIKISGSHFDNPVFDFTNAVDIESFYINSFTSIGIDSGAYSDFKVRQTDGSTSTIDSFIIDGYSFSSPLKLGSLIDLNKLNSSVFKIRNSNVAATTTLMTLSNCVLGKVFLENNSNDNSANGVQLVNTSATEMQLVGSYFKNASNFALSQDAASNIVSLKANAYISNDNTGFSSNSFITYQDNSVTKTIQPVVTATLNQVLTNGNTSSLGMSVNQVELGSGASDTVPTVSWNYSGSFGWGLFERLSDGDFRLSSKSSGTPVHAFTVNRDTGRMTFHNLAGTGTRTVVADASGNLSATSAAPTSGTYTPTLTNVSNVTSFSSIFGTYSQVGDIVTVNVSFNITVTSTGQSIFSISLPINRSVSSTRNILTGTVNSGSTYLPVFGQTTSTTLVNSCAFNATAATSYIGSVTFQYSIN